MKHRRSSEYDLAVRRQALEWKRATAHLSAAAKRPGVYNEKPFDRALPIACAEENLWAPIRAPLVALFQAQGIAWHDQDRPEYGLRTSPGPTPNLVSSQVAALNFWFGLATVPPALQTVLRSVFPEASKAVPPVPGGPLLEPEWIGLHNYLNERVPAGEERIRGSMVTSGDFLLAYEDVRGLRHGVLIECKYREHALDAEFEYFSSRGTDRRDIYRQDFESDSSPIRQDLGLKIDDFIIDPFYQHLREQLLAGHMAAAHELRFHTVVVLHVAPRANRALHENVTSPALQRFGGTVAEAWQSILADPSSYRSVAFEDLFAVAAAIGDKDLQPWLEYQKERYDWEGAVHE